MYFGDRTLGYEFWRLLFQSGHRGAIDLLSIRQYAVAWVQGIDIYRVTLNKTYPPATQPIFWLLMGWLDATPVRILWAIISLSSLIYLSRMILGVLAPAARLEGWFLALLPFCLYPFGAAIGNGQVAPPILAVLVAGILGLSTGKPSLARQLGAIGLFLVALSKPTIAAPFFWIVTFALPNLLPAAGVILGYALLTLLGASFQASDPVTLFREWLQSNTAGRTAGPSDVSTRAKILWASRLEFAGRLVRSDRAGSVGLVSPSARYLAPSGSHRSRREILDISLVVRR